MATITVLADMNTGTIAGISWIQRANSTAAARRRASSSDSPTATANALVEVALPPANDTADWNVLLVTHVVPRVLRNADASRLPAG
ncbi:MAG: hypothetical protein R6W77_03885 [Trueperaceae bacterium]